MIILLIDVKVYFLIDGILGLNLNREEMNILFLCFFFLLSFIYWFYLIFLLLFL